MTTIENEYYLRATILTFEGGVFVTRKVLESKVGSNGGDLNDLLLRNKRKLKHEFHKKQLKKFFPLNGETDITTWDFGMLTGVLLIMFKPTLDDEDRNAIRAIKSIRNDVLAHSPTISLSIDTFEWCRDEVEKAITQLCSTFDDTIKNECKRIINKTLNGPLDIQSCLDRLKESRDTDERLFAIMSKLDATEERLSEIYKAFHDELENQKSDILKEIRNAVKEEVRKDILKEIRNAVKEEVRKDEETEKWIKKAWGILSTLFVVVTILGGLIVGTVRHHNAAFDSTGTIETEKKCEQIPNANGSVIYWSSSGLFNGINWEYMGLCIHPCTQKAAIVFNGSSVYAAENCQQNLRTQIAEHEEHKIHEEHKQQDEHKINEEHKPHDVNKEHEGHREL